MKCEICGNELSHQEHCRTPKMLLEIMDEALQVAYKRKMPIVTSDCVKQAVHNLYCCKSS